MNRKKLTSYLMKENKLFWDEYASDFDAIYGTNNSLPNRIINKLFRQAIKLRFEKTLASIPDDNVSVIDIVGPGHYCFALAKDVKKEVLGVDYSESMINIANQHYEKIKINGNLNFKVSNIVEFESVKKFDYSIMMGFIEYFENPEAIIRKAVSITNKKIFISFPVAGGILGLSKEIKIQAQVLFASVFIPGYK